MNLATIYEDFTFDNIALCRVIVLEKSGIMKIAAYTSLLLIPNLKWHRKKMHHLNGKATGTVKITPVCTTYWVLTYLMAWMA
jgi:hypothetical protein